MQGEAQGGAGRQEQRLGRAQGLGGGKQEEDSERQFRPWTENKPLSPAAPALG